MCVAAVLEFSSGCGAVERGGGCGQVFRLNKQRTLLEEQFSGDFGLFFSQSFLGCESEIVGCSLMLAGCEVAFGLLFEFRQLAAQRSQLTSSVE